MTKMTKLKITKTAKTTKATTFNQNTKHAIWNKKCGRNKTWLSKKCFRKRWVVETTSGGRNTF